MEKAKAEAFALALALPGQGYFALRMLGPAGAPEITSYSCTIDPPAAPLVFVANRKRDGGSWLVSFGFRDHNRILSLDPWLRRYEIEALDRRRGTRDIYRFMGIERVWLTTKLINFRLQTSPGEFVSFEVEPWRVPSRGLWLAANAALAAVQTDPLTT